MKSYSYTAPGVGHIECFPSIKSREIKAGWEKVTIGMPHSFFLFLARRAEEPEKMKIILAEIYPAFPPVDPRDIVAPALDMEQGKVIYSIRRGHFFLGEFFKEHKDPALELQGLVCSCHPGEVETFQVTSIPYYKLTGE